MNKTRMPVLEDPLVRELAALGESYDAAPVYPARSMDLLARHGLLARFAPPEAGGRRFADRQVGHLDLFDALRRVGRGDLSVGRLFEGHANAVALFGWYGTPAQKAWLGQSLARNAVFGVWATEPQPGVKLEAGEGPNRLMGAKSFASGAGGISYTIVTVQPETGDRRLAIVAADDQARAETSAWRVRGMRASMSGAYDLDGYIVENAMLLGQPGDYDREPRFTSGAWRFTAVQLGGIEALLAETRAAMSPVARADPLARAAFGHALVATRTAWLWVRKAALLAACEDPDASAFARMTRGVVERAGLDVMEHAARLIGTRSAFAGQRIDKIVRDLSLYLRQAGPDQVRDAAVCDWIDHDCFGEDPLW